MKRVLTVVSCLLATVLIGLWWPKDTAPPVTLVDIDSTDTSGYAVTVDPGARLIMLSGHPLSLNGEALEPDPEVIRLFDDWATRHADRDFRSWRDEMLNLAVETLPVPALAQLEHWLDQYAELNLASQLLGVEGEPDWSRILAHTSELRGLYFREADRSLFAHIQALEGFTRDAMSLSSDGLQTRDLHILRSRLKELPPQERERARGWLDRLTGHMQQEGWQSMNDEQQRHRVHAGIAGLLAGPSIDFGEENLAFLQRYETYAAERETLPPLDDASMAVLRERHFQGTEITRAMTLDRVLAQ